MSAILHSNRTSHHSESGQGLFTLGVGNMAFFPLHRISQDAERIYQDAKAAIDAMDPTSLLPGLLEQYETQLRRMDPGSSDIPNCELIGFPGHLSRPSKLKFIWCGIL